jgi:hypothetical protein
MSHDDKDDHSKSLTSHDGQPSDQEKPKETADDAVDDEQAHLSGLGTASSEPA